MQRLLRSEFRANMKKKSFLQAEEFFNHDWEQTEHCQNLRQYSLSRLMTINWDFRRELGDHYIL